MRYREHLLISAVPASPQQLCCMDTKSADSMRSENNVRIRLISDTDIRWNVEGKT
ncbi:hypothetical protein [Candidatus Methanomassiliicoccus intestinalis]|uniref:hypothetical protein n=1 Tax=Candidatus Methanomassiliicoccus intestinalis TaxID=1406512 RepID=UPI00155AEDC6|nr:hypothetical protein [Candidatus Methanomassiliicoccus intestinalis]